MDLIDVEKFESGIWFTIDFTDLTKGDLFRLRNPYTLQLREYKGDTEYLAVSELYTCDKKGVLVIASL